MIDFRNRAISSGILKWVFDDPSPKTTVLMPFPSLSWLRRIANNFLRFDETLATLPNRKKIWNFLIQAKLSSFSQYVFFLGEEIPIPPSKPLINQHQATLWKESIIFWIITMYWYNFIQFPFWNPSTHPNTTGNPLQPRKMSRRDQRDPRHPRACALHWAHRLTRPRTTWAAERTTCWWLVGG